jgi:hypothetical protein
LVFGPTQIYLGRQAFGIVGVSFTLSKPLGSLDVLQEALVHCLESCYLEADQLEALLSRQAALGAKTVNGLLVTPKSGSTH